MKVVVTGAQGMLGTALLESLKRADYESFPMDIDTIDIRDRDKIVSAIVKIQPDAVVNAAAYTDVDGCESERELAFSVNGEGAGNVAAAAREVQAVMIQISTDYIFDGRKGTYYKETDPANPESVYASSKLKGEAAVAEEGGRFFIIRTSWLYGKGGKNFVDTICRLADEREELSVVDDQIGSPTYTGHLASAITRILRTYIQSRMGKPGIYHVTGDGFCSWYEFAQKIVELHPGRVERVLPISTEEFGRPAARPHYSVLSNNKVKTTFGVALPHWEDALAEYLSS